MLPEHAIKSWDELEELLGVKISLTCWRACSQTVEKRYVRRGNDEHLRTYLRDDNDSLIGMSQGETFYGSLHRTDALFENYFHAWAYHLKRRTELDETLNA